MRFKVSLLFPEVHPYMMYCFQMQKAYKRSSTSPDDAKQVKEMTKIPIIYEIISLSHTIILVLSNSNWWTIKQSSSISYRNKTFQPEITFIQIRESSSILYSFRSNKKKFIQIKESPVKWHLLHTSKEWSNFVSTYYNSIHFRTNSIILKQIKNPSDWFSSVGGVFVIVYLIYFFLVTTSSSPAGRSSIFSSK